MITNTGQTRMRREDGGKGEEECTSVNPGE